MFGLVYALREATFSHNETLGCVIQFFNLTSCTLIKAQEKIYTLTFTSFYGLGSPNRLNSVYMRRANCECVCVY